VLVNGPPGRETSFFEAESEDRFLVAEGVDQGELLRVVRDDIAVVTRMIVATYPLTREPQTFG